MEAIEACDKKKEAKQRRKIFASAAETEAYYVFMWLLAWSTVESEQPEGIQLQRWAAV